MPMCAECGQENRSGARFCFNCATPLRPARPTGEDRQWLADSLTQTLVSAESAVSSTVEPLVAPGLVPDEEMIMIDEPAPRLFAGRYEWPADADPALLQVVDTKPWLRCWACGSTANEQGDAFCNDCGASLMPRTYRASLTTREAPVGVALVKSLTDEALRAVLPDVVEVIEEGDEILTLLGDRSRGPLTPPLDETTALLIGAVLARLAFGLQQHGLALGMVDVAEVELIPGGARLTDAPNLHRVAEGEPDAAAQADLAALAELLEQATETPRTTQRLSEDDAATLIMDDQPGLASVLRQVRTREVHDLDGFARQLEAILAERTSPTALRQVLGAASDVGIVRDHNEDSYLTLQLGLDNDGQAKGWGLYLVSDGMGGHAAGELASGLAIRAASNLIITEYLNRMIQPDAVYNEAEAKDLVRRAVLAANEAILQEARTQGNDMGATLTMALVVGDRAVVGNVGDSRTYLFREGKLRRISRDHSLVQRLVDLGQITDNDIYTHPQRNAVLRSLGDRSQVDVDLFTERLHPGDALFLCSDGQWEMTHDPEMERMIGQSDDPHAICQALVSAANQAGGEDNITAVLVWMR